ncbi:MAG: PilZ domain-containing protein [Bacteriovoracaceae bacterium]|nr:PilZ domain-containing protein [Bacteriovoracaceae bacterium]
MTERRFNLIKTDFEQHEKRVFPRFPVCYLTFKPEQGARAHEIKDISFTGMQLGINEGCGVYTEGQQLNGTVHWLGHELNMQGKVMWSTKGRIGIEFVKRVEQGENLKKFLSEERLVSALKPLHRVDYGAELPSRLKYWLRSDGPVEILVWKHNDGEMAQFQVLLLENFVEWQDGHGLKTGRILSKRNVDTPLLDEDELVFRVDEGTDEEKLQRARSLVSKIPEHLLSLDALEFLMLKLS